MVNINRLPYQVTDFRTLIDDSRIYVDKTDLIANLALGVGPFFLARPRRFGKSTLVSTFEELFSHGLEKFKGLKIDTQNLWQDKTYKVLHLDFSYIKEDSEEVPFSTKFYEALKSGLDDLGIKLEESSYVIASFNNAIKAVDNKSIVLLIDEYDAPLTTVMGKKEEFEKRRELFSEFFLTIKRYSAKFRFVFITGVTRYSHTAIFSGFNNIEDISFDDDFGTLLGYTQEELEFYFKDYLENAACALNKEKNTDEYTYKLVLEKVKDYYDGYSFDKKCRTHVYNPWSILKFLKKPKDDFGSYWLDTGGAQPSLLVKYLESTDKKNLTEAKLKDYLNLNITKRTLLEDLSPRLSSLEEDDFPILPILYQAGYFTIKKGNGRVLQLGIPNLEVREAFAKIIIQKLTQYSDIDGFKSAYEDTFLGALKNKDLDKLKQVFNLIINIYSYRSLLRFDEYLFRDVFLFASLLLNIVIEPHKPQKDPFGAEIEVQREVENSYGRIDLYLKCEKYIYAFEFKVATSESEAEINRKFNEALAQIHDNHYGEMLEGLIENREVIALACVIVNQKRADDLKPLHKVVKLEQVPIVLS